MTIENTELTRQFPALDTLRAVGSFGVVVTHAAFWTGSYADFGVLGPLLSRLDVGVALFFVLSGFLLSRQWFVRAQHGLSLPRVPRYFLKRLLRIWPVYVVAAVAAMAFLTDNQGKDVLEWVVTLTLLDIYVDDVLPAGLTQMWSLATEVAFYVVLPVLMLLVVPRRRPARNAAVGALVVAMVALTLLWVTVLAPRMPEGMMVAQWLPAYTSWFAVGIALAHLQVRHAAGVTGVRTERWLAVVTSSPGALWALAGGLLLVSATPLAGPTLLLPPTDAEAVVKNLLYAAIGGLLVLAGAFTGPDQGLTRLMSASWARHLGHISYGVFCLHLPILHLVMWVTGFQLFAGNFVTVLVLTTVLSVMAAEVAYRAVELPFMRLASPRRGRDDSSATPKTEASAR